MRTLPIIAELESSLALDQRTKLIQESVSVRLSQFTSSVISAESLLDASPRTAHIKLVNYVVRGILSC